MSLSDHPAAVRCVRVSPAVLQRLIDYLIEDAMRQPFDPRFVELER
jgi:hypothetical protein